MTPFGDLVFLQPAFLAALIALPILWWLLRATPPAPKRERFPGVRLLLDLLDRERTPDKTPWWLLLLRMLALAALIGAFAEPVLNPKQRIAGEGPLLIVMDGGWGSAAEWSDRRAAALDAVEQARDAGRPVALAVLSDPAPAPEAFQFLDAESQARAIAALEPFPWRPAPERLMTAVAAAPSLDTIWLHDGLDHVTPAVAAEEETADSAVAALAVALAEKGPLRVVGPSRRLHALSPPEIRDGALVATVLRVGDADRDADAPPIRVAAIGADGEGGVRRLASAAVEFEAGADQAEVEIAMPVELRNALTRLEIDAAGHAGAAALLDDRWRRRTVALVSGERDRAGQPLLSGLHYLRAALEPHAEYREADLVSALGGPAAVAALEAGPSDDEDDAAAPSGWADVIVMSDVGRLDESARAALINWVDAGGLLVRFAGPQLAAAAAETSRIGRRTDAVEDPLLPTRLRGGGRALGGALSWAAPQRLRPFPEESPFFGLTQSLEVEVSRQVLAEPSPGLSGRVWAALEDGTPLVTSAAVGEGRVVLFHVTASSAWSSLPLSGLFVEMMGRLVAVAPALAASASALADDAALWRPETVMNAFGRVAPAAEDAAPVEGAALAAGVALGVAPGVYVSEQTDTPKRLAVSALGEGETLSPRPTAPDGAVVETLSPEGETDLKPWLLALGLALLLIDAAVSLFIAGGLRRRARMAGVALIAAAAALAGAGDAALAQTGEVDAVSEEVPIDPSERHAALETVLGYIVTGDERVDRVSQAGLRGLSVTLFQRTAIEPSEPAAVDIEVDDVSVYAILYWPVTRVQRTLSDEAVRKLNAFMRTGGLLVIDTKDAHQTFGAGDGPNANDLRRLAGPLDLPPLSPAPRDHILTRSFYLIDEMPGRWAGGPVWVEARAPVDPALGLTEERANANDGVSPIIIGGADWAGAWAIDNEGLPLFAMGRGGERQREMAWRFGINLAMYAFTGNYKSDQVHIPALLQRLGN